MPASPPRSFAGVCSCLALLVVAGCASVHTVSTPAPRHEVVHAFDFRTGDAHGWRPVNSLAPFDLSAGVLRTRVTGGDAHMMVSGLSLSTATVSHVVFRMKSDRPGATQVYFATTGDPDLAGKPVPAVSCEGDGVWHEYEAKLHGIKGFTGNLTDLRLDPVNGQAGEDATVELAWVRLVRQAPRIVLDRLSPNRALTPVGESVTVSARVKNVGGPVDTEIEGVLETGPGLEVTQRPGTVSIPDDGGLAVLRWQVTPRREGVLSFRAVLRNEGRVLFDARSLVLAGPEPGPMPSGAAPILIGRGVSLEFLSGTNGAAAAVLRTRVGERWHATALLYPLAQLAAQVGGRTISHDISFDRIKVRGYQATLNTSTAGGRCELRFRLVPDAPGHVAVDAALTATEQLAVTRFSGPVLRVGVGSNGAGKTGGLFPGQEFLEGDEPSSNTEVVGRLHGYRPHPDARTITVPALAIRKDGVLTGMMWDPLQDWGGGPDAMPAAEFASPNFLDEQPNHLIGAFLPDAPWRQEGDGVAAEPFLLAGRGKCRLRTRIFARPGRDLIDVVPLWYATYGLPEPPPPSCSDRQALDLLVQGYGQTLFDPEKRGFTTHYKHGNEQPRWIPAYAARVLVHHLRTGERRWIDSIGVAPDSSLLELLGTMFSSPAVPAAPGCLAQQRPDGLWPYHEETSHKLDRPLGKEGEAYIGHSISRFASPLLNHAQHWGDERSLAAGLKALAACEAFRVPKGAQTWEVPAETPDLYGAARIAGVFLQAHRLTGDQEYVEWARYWLYTGLPFLYAYRVPGTGPGATALVSGKGQRPGTDYFRDPNRHETTPWASIPVFGTSIYTVKWFGVPVHFCGLVWAHVVYDYLNHVDDPVLRAAADGVTQVGVNMTLDKEPYVGLLPDSWHIISNRAQPALIGPMRVEPPLRARMDLPSYGHVNAAVVRTGTRRLHIRSRGIIGEQEAKGRDLSWQQRFVPGQVCETMVLTVEPPDTLRAGRRGIPPVANILDATEGWQYLTDLKAVAIRTRHRREFERVAVSWR